MAYIINKFNGTQLVVLEDGTLDTSTSLGLVGRNYTGYGEIQNENFLFLLENFANNNPPARPLPGQTWYDSSVKKLKIYDGQEWNSVGSAAVENFAPPELEGALWLNSETQQLYVFNNGWNLIGPEAVPNFGTTRLRARTIKDTLDNDHPVLDLVVNNETIAFISSDEFTISLVDNISGFSTIRKGINFSNQTTESETTYNLIGNLIGNATTASRLADPKKINGVNFDGQTDITIKSSTTSILTKGTYLTGSNFDGSFPTTWSVDASSANVIGKVVARDSSGDFSAGTITATFNGNLIGNVTASSGTSFFDIIEANQVIGARLSGNAFTATKLETGRNINGVFFDGTSDVTVTASATTLSGTFINPTVVNSSLQSVGILSNLKITDLGLIIGDNDSIKLFTDGSENPVIASQLAGKSINLQINDVTRPGGSEKIKFIPADVALNSGGPNNPSLVPNSSSSVNIGIPTAKWKNIYADFFIGTATTAQYADLAENYTSDKQYDPGTVLEFGGEFEVREALQDSNSIAGVVSTNPAYLMNSNLESKYVVSVALQGRVPCKVLGSVKKGQMLVSAGNGYAKAAFRPEIGTVIGKSLEDFDGKEGIIEVVVGRL
jgi:hypothetical protein